MIYLKNKIFILSTLFMYRLAHFELQLQKSKTISDHKKKLANRN